jgi:hypothetical protein
LTPEWSALALIEAPDFVEQAHRQFIASGAEIITTNSYSILPHQIGDAFFQSNGLRLADLAGRLARHAAGNTIAVAGSLPPQFGSYKPQLFDAARTRDPRNPDRRPCAAYRSLADRDAKLGRRNASRGDSDAQTRNTFYRPKIFLLCISER